MATLTVEKITESGLAPTYIAADAGGDTFPNPPSGQGVFLHVKNGDASSHTVTVTPANASNDFPGWGEMTKAPIVVAVPAGEDRFIGPFPYTPYQANPAITYDDVTSVTVAAIRVDL